MSRGLSTTNEAQVDSNHIQQVTLVKLEFGTPVYVHSGIGDIVYDANTYLGVGHLGSISVARESEVLGPGSLTLSLDATEADYITEALDAGNLYDVVTIYEGYRQDDGTLYDTPWIVWKGWYEYSEVAIGDGSNIAMVCQHDLAAINEKNGARYSDEDQQNAYSTDVGLEFAATIVNVKLLWGGGTPPSIPRSGPRNEPEPFDL